MDASNSFKVEAFLDDQDKVGLRIIPTDTIAQTLLAKMFNETKDESSRVELRAWQKGGGLSQITFQAITKGK